jgi:hypothetical protein
MSARRPDRITRIDRTTAEQILDGDLADPPAGPDDLVRLLATAAAPAGEPGAPAQGGEIAGEEAAVAAFLRARPEPTAQPRRDPMIKTALAKALTMKIAAAALAAVTAGGVWAATQTSALRSLIGGTAPGARPAVTHSPARSAPPDERAAYGIASLAGVCQAYLAESQRPGVPRPKIAREFGTLIAAAGGTEAKADAYCRGLLRALRHRYPAGLPSHLPTRLPAGSPAKLPTALPTTLPTALPTSLPVPVPSILPTRLPIPSPTILPRVPVPHPGQ